VSFTGLELGASKLVLADADGERSTVETENLVLAMPRRALELIDLGLQDNPRLKRLISTVTSEPAFKLYLFYKERWWERLGIMHGRSVSDLPIRQTYYLAPQPWKGGGPIPEYGMLLASYNDARAVDFWDGLARPLGERENERQTLRAALVELVQESSLPGNAEDFVPDPPPHLHLATDEMLRHARSQLALLHGVPESEVPEAVVGGYGDWSRDPFGGGWNVWDSQVDVREAMTNIKIPFGPDRRVYIVGDAYSGEQGWVEGALTATEKTLQAHLELAAPDWLPKDYYIGW
jgi:monoamine oxidase